MTQKADTYNVEIVTLIRDVRLSYSLKVLAVFEI